MKILIVSDHCGPHDEAAAGLSESAAYWSAWGHQTTEISTCAAASKIRRSESATENGTALLLLRFIELTGRAIAAGLFQRRPDIILCASPQFFAAATAGWVLSMRHWRPLVLAVNARPSVYSSSTPAQTRFRRKLLEMFEAFLCRRAAAAAAADRQLKDHLVLLGVAPGSIAAPLSAFDGLSAPHELSRRRAEEMLQAFEIVRAGWPNRVAEGCDKPG